MTLGFVGLAVGKGQGRSASFSGFIPLCSGLITNFTNQVIPGQDGTGDLIDSGNCKVLINESKPDVESGQDDLQPLSIIIWLFSCLFAK